MQPLGVVCRAPGLWTLTTIPFAVDCFADRVLPMSVRLVRSGQ